MSRIGKVFNWLASQKRAQSTSLWYWHTNYVINFHMRSKRLKSSSVKPGKMLDNNRSNIHKYWSLSLFIIEAEISERIIFISSQYKWSTTVAKWLRYTEAWHFLVWYWTVSGRLLQNQFKKDGWIHYWHLRCRVLIEWGKILKKKYHQIYLSD